MKQLTAYTADQLFTGEEWLKDTAILVEKGIITALKSVADLPTTIPLERFDQCTLAPAFIDLQIYGAGGKLFSVYPDTAALALLKTDCENGGAAYCLPTVATNSYEVFYQCIDAIKSYWATGGEGVLGLHIEGPWINTTKRGAHIASYIHTPTIEQVSTLLDYGEGVIKMITLAPEILSQEIIALIVSKGIIISAGHSNVTYEVAMKSFDNGIAAVTHLYNAMSPLQHRSPGLVGAAMNHQRVMASIIPDGYHVDFAAVQVARKIMQERLFVITDAVTETAEGLYQHEKAGDKFEAAGILSGSALTMNSAVKNLVTHCGVDLSEAVRMCSYYPAKLMGLDKKMGLLKPSYKASIVVLNKDLTAVSVIR